jgi:hypothetical protein
VTGRSGEAPGFDAGADPVRNGDRGGHTLAWRALTPFSTRPEGGNVFAIFVPVFDGDTLRVSSAATLGGNAWFQSLLKGRFPEYQIDLDEGHAGGRRRRRLARPPVRWAAPAADRQRRVGIA